jgi:hypothetical protein
VSRVEALDDTARADFDYVLERVATLGDDRGRHAILIAAGPRREWFDAAMDRHHGPADSALWCLLEYPDVFRRAEIVFAEECARERPHEYVGSFMTDPAPGFSLNELSPDDLKCEFLAAYHARGDRCTDLMLYLEERSVPDGARRTEIVVQRKGRPTTEHLFEGDDPVHRRLIPVMPDTVIFHPVTGLVEIISRHGDVHRERLATAFCDAALGREPPARVEPVSISFEPLRQPRKFDGSPSDGVRDVRLFELRVKNGKNGYELIRADNDEDVYACMRRRETMHLLNGDIDRAAFEVWFVDGKWNSRGKPFKLVIAGQDAISFPKWSLSRQAIGRKLLAEWGLIAE